MAKASTKGSMNILEFLLLLESTVPPPLNCHHVILAAKYGSDKEGWNNRLAVQINVNGKFQCFFLDDADLATEAAVLVSRITMLLTGTVLATKIQYSREASSFVE
jgi:hypothetical protein